MEMVEEGVGVVSNLQQVHLRGKLTLSASSPQTDKVDDNNETTTMRMMSYRKPSRSLGV